MPYGKAKQSSLILDGCRNENTYASAFLEKKQTWGLNFSEINDPDKNTLGTLLIQNLALSHNKPEFLKE
jgi:hypothetical protein